MAKYQLPTKPVMSSANKEHGREDVVMIDAFPVSDKELLRLTFESVHSPRQQGVWMSTDDGLVVAGQHCPSVDLWQHTAPAEVLIECRTTSGCLHLYNIWVGQSGRNSQGWSSGMLVEELSNGRRYRCNDSGFKTDFDKLIFRIERV